MTDSCCAFTVAGGVMGLFALLTDYYYSRAINTYINDVKQKTDFTEKEYQIYLKDIKSLENWANRWYVWKPFSKKPAKELIEILKGITSKTTN